MIVIFGIESFRILLKILLNHQTLMAADKFVGCNRCTPRHPPPALRWGGGCPTRSLPPSFRGRGGCRHPRPWVSYRVDSGDSGSLEGKLRCHSWDVLFAGRGSVKSAAVTTAIVITIAATVAWPPPPYHYHTTTIAVLSP